MDQFFAAGGNQTAWLANHAEMVLFQQGRGFLHPVLQGLGGFESGIVARPLVLPVDREGAEAEHGKSEAGQGTGGHPVQAGQPGGATLNPLGREGSLDEPEGATVAWTALRTPLGWGGEGGDQGICASTAQVNHPSAGAASGWERPAGCQPERSRRLRNVRPFQSACISTEAPSLPPRHRSQPRPMPSRNSGASSPRLRWASAKTAALTSTA